MQLAGGARHVWACPPNMRGYLPGLVIDWRQAAGDWWALVTTADRLEVTTQWMERDSLQVRPGNPPAFGFPAQGVVCPKCGHQLTDR